MAIDAETAEFIMLNWTIVFHVSQRYFKRPSLYLAGRGTLTIILKKTAKNQRV